MPKIVFQTDIAPLYLPLMCDNSEMEKYTSSVIGAKTPLVGLDMQEARPDVVGNPVTTTIKAKSWQWLSIAGSLLFFIGRLLNEGNTVQSLRENRAKHVRVVEAK